MHFFVHICVVLRVQDETPPPRRSIRPTLSPLIPSLPFPPPPHTPPPLCLCNPCQLALLANPSALISWATHPVRDRTGTGADRGGMLYMCVCVCVCASVCVFERLYMWGGGWCRPESINWSLCLRPAQCVCLWASCLFILVRPFLTSLLLPLFSLGSLYIYTYLAYICMFYILGFFVWFCLEQILMDFLLVNSDPPPRIFFFPATFSSFLSRLHVWHLPASRPFSPPLSAIPSSLCALPPCSSQPRRTFRGWSCTPRATTTAETKSGPRTWRRKYSSASLFFLTSSLEKNGCIWSKKKKNNNYTIAVMHREKNRDFNACKVSRVHLNNKKAQISAWFFCFVAKFSFIC